MSCVGRYSLSAPAVCKSRINFQCVRFARHKPWHPKFKLMRKLQPFERPPDPSKIRAQYGKDINQQSMQIFQRMKEDGFLMPRAFMDRMMTMTHTGQILEPYVPPEGDGKASILSTARAGQELTKVTEKTKSYRAERMIRRYDENFNSSNFASMALDIYKQAHTLLQDFENHQVELLDLVTERAFADMTDGLERKTFRWNYHSSIDPPKSVHMRVGNLLSEDNRFGQVTVRIFSKQSMAIYDRFGRPIYGSENLLKDVLEYVVFEKHLADEYGAWKLHGKIIPDWMPRKNFYHRTLRVSDSNDDDFDEEFYDTDDEQVKVIDEDVEEVRAGQNKQN